MNPVILFDNIMTEGAITATSTATDYDVDNLSDYRGYTKWKATGSGTQHITITDLLEGSSAPVRSQTGWYIKLQNNALLEQVSSGVDTADAIGILNHNLGTIGATIKVQYKLSGVWTTIATINPSDDEAILETFTSKSSADWRIELSSMTAAPEIGVIFLGVHLLFPWPPEAPVIPEEEGIKAFSEYSGAGHLLGTVLAYNPVTINPRWTNLTRTWYSTSFLPFWDNHGKLIFPFFYAWDLTNRPDDIFYVSIDPGMVRMESLDLLTYTKELTLQMKSAGA